MHPLINCKVFSGSKENSFDSGFGVSRVVPSDALLIWVRQAEGPRTVGGRETAGGPSRVNPFTFQDTPQEPRRVTSGALRAPEVTHGRTLSGSSSGSLGGGGCSPHRSLSSSETFPPFCDALYACFHRKSVSSM